METMEKDVVIIGSGTAGLAAYRAAREHTDSVITIEGGPYGTTCARVGCMPSKLLIAAAESVHGIQTAPGFGVYPGAGLTINGPEVMDRVKRERDRFVGFVVESIDNIPAEFKLRGYAQFVDDHTLHVCREDNGETVQINAQRIVIATGSRPARPKIFHELGDRLIVNDDVFEWDDLPESIAVFGLGVIGLEIGQALHRLGVKVHMFGRSGRVGPTTDPLLQEYSHKTFADEIPMTARARVKGVRKEGDGVILKYEDQNGGIHEIHVQYVLAATGREPNVDNLGIENTPLKLDEQGIPMFDPHTMQCSTPHIFIAGDANDEEPLLHEAADQGKIAGDNAGRYPNIRAGLRRALISVVFSDPQIAIVGPGWKKLNEKYSRCECMEIGKVSFEDQGRSRVMMKNKGLMHVYGEHGTGLFLGAEIIGPAAEHLAHLLSWALQNRMTIPQMLDMPFYHPVIEEGLRTALRDLNAKLHIGERGLKNCLDCGAGG